MYSFAPILENGGTMKLGRSAVGTLRPQPECAGPTTAPCFFAQRRVLSPSVGQRSEEVVPGYICSRNRRRHRCPLWCEPKPETSMSYRSRYGYWETLSTAPQKNCFW